MTDKRIEAVAFAREHMDDFLASLKEFLKIPSVSTDPDFVPDMLNAANWMADRLKMLGMDNVQIFPTDKHPFVYGDSLHKPGAPTVLIYGHYDVQPPDPMELWETSPFDPTIRDDNLYARGASDMKGQIIASVVALESILSQGELPVNIKFFLEGEEESGSPSMDKFLRENKELLAADFALNPDTGMMGADIPTITYGLRGMAYFEIHVQGPDHDLHSGMFGGIVHNPAIVLCELIAGMHDENGTITLPGFYDRVPEMTEKEHMEMSRLPVSDETYLSQTGVPALWGEKEFTPVERTGARPTLDVNGFLSGYTGEGSKTIIPSKAMAKVSMRLVPFQDPDEVEQQLKQYLEENVPDDVTWKLKFIEPGAPASITNIELPATQALYKALNDVWQITPVYKREGGSVPVVGAMQEHLGIESVLTGFGLPDDKIHSPNEKLHIPTWKKGIEALIHFFYNLAE
jgi:acetylornithine deacetylase/succinyl-diaminopimelate desuccinylase-like protein